MTPFQYKMRCNRPLDAILIISTLGKYADMDILPPRHPEFLYTEVTFSSCLSRDAILCIINTKEIKTLLVDTLPILTLQTIDNYVGEEVPKIEDLPEKERNIVSKLKKKTIIQYNKKNKETQDKKEALQTRLTALKEKRNADLAKIKEMSEKKRLEFNKHMDEIMRNLDNLK